MERSELVVTKQDLKKSETLFNNLDVIESCERGRAITKCKSYKLTNVTFFASLLKELPVGCKIHVMPESLIKNQTFDF